MLKKSMSDEKLYYLNDFKTMKRETPVFAKSISEIKKYAPVFGTQILDVLKEKNVGILPHSNLDGPAYYDPGLKKTGLFIYNNRAPDFYTEMILHEGYHAYQDHMHALMTRNFHASAENTIMQMMLLEAGAMSYAAVAMYEMKLNGKPDAFNHRSYAKPHLKSLNKLHRDFEKDYISFTEKGYTRNDALIHAGKKFFKNVTSNFTLQEGYIDMAIDFLLEYLGTRKEGFALYGPNKSNINGSDIPLYGELKQGRSLADDFNTVQLRKNINKYPHLKDFVDWYEHQRLLVHFDFNETHKHVIKSTEDLKAKKNIFASLDIGEYIDLYNQNARRQDPVGPIQVALAAVNDIRGLQKSFVFDDKPKLSNPTP